MQKIKEQHYGLISSQNRMGQVESDTKKKIYRSDSFHLDPEYGIPKN